GDCLALIHVLFLWPREPTPVQRLVPQQSQPRLVTGLPRQPVQGEIGQYVRDVPLVLGAATGPDEFRVVVVALPLEHLPFVESHRIVPVTMTQMPLTEQSSAIARRLHQRRKRRLRGIKTGG